MQLVMRTHGVLSVYEIDTFLKQSKSRILDMEEFFTIYSRSGVNLDGYDITEDTHGIILLECVDRKKRFKAKEVFEEVDHRVSDIAGIIIELKEEKSVPPVGKPIKIEPETREIEKHAFTQRYR